MEGLVCVEGGQCFRTSGLASSKDGVVDRFDVPRFGLVPVVECDIFKAAKDAFWRSGEDICVDSES